MRRALFPTDVGRKRNATHVDATKYDFTFFRAMIFLSITQSLCHPEERSDEGSGSLRDETNSGEVVSIATVQIPRFARDDKASLRTMIARVPRSENHTLW
jgi:hypothetical protein